MKIDAERQIDELLRKGELAQTQQDSDFDWERNVRIPLWMTKRMAIWAVSQFQHGELATARMCRAIRDDVGSAAARAFLETQHLDERRHARIYGRYLGKLGGAVTPSAVLENCYEQALAWQGPSQAIMLAFHVILEGESIRLQKSVDTWMTCPLFKEISAVIARDEARHVAFGKIYLRETLPELPRRQRLAIYLWLRDLWLSGATAVINRIMPMGLLGQRTVRGFMASGWQERLRDLGRAGLLSDEERPLFLAS